MTDLVRGWWVIVVASIVLPSLLSYIWLVSMKKYTRVVIWSSLVLIVALGVLFTVFLFAQAGEIKYDWIAQYNLEKYAFLSNESTLYLAYSIAIFMTILILALFAMRRNIVRSIDVLRLGSKALKNLPMTLVFPMWAVIGMFGLFVWAAFVAASLASAGDAVIIDIKQVVSDITTKYNSTVPPRILDAIKN